MLDLEPPVSGQPWHKRHPLLSRSLLYGAGVGLAAALLFSLVGRSQEDAARRREALDAELDLLEVVHAMDPSGDLVLKLLDEKFSGDELTTHQRGRALRWRALALRKKKDREGVEAAFQAAEALDLEPLERAALHLEWAEARIAAPDLRGAQALLPAGRLLQDHPTLLLLRALLSAQIQAGLHSPKEGRTELDEILSGLPQPLDPEREVYVGGRPWLASQAATVATEFLAQGPEERGQGQRAGLWRRLHLLAPLDFDAQVACARAFLGEGLTAEARQAFAVARALDPALAQAEVRRDPQLGSLQKHKKSLQPPSHPGR